jgi:hypothetical protein
VEALAVDVGVCASHGPPGPALSPWPVYFPDVGLPGARTLESSSSLQRGDRTDTGEECRGLTVRRHSKRSTKQGRAWAGVSGPIAVLGRPDSRSGAIHRLTLALARASTRR